MGTVSRTYDLVVIGGGSAGLIAIGFAAELGASVALIEKDRIGGDCTWSGCVPSKTLIKAARVAHHMRTADRYGVSPAEPSVDLESVMRHVHAVRDEVYQEEAPEAVRAKGVDVYLGGARFLDPHTLGVNGETLKARNVVIATGAHPYIPAIEGIDGVDYLTYETVWDLKRLPKHLMVLGAGPIGSEMAQTFRRLGARVTLIEGGDRVLPRDEPEASRVMGRAFQQEGIEILFHSKAERAWEDENGIHLVAGGVEVVGDALLVSTGRRPNVDGLDLEKAGVAYTGRGIQTDKYLRTTQKHIYAAGDCVGGYQFTHYAGWQAFIAARNALLPGVTKGVTDRVPWTTFTEPEVAHVGMMEAQARGKYGDAVVVSQFPMAQVDRGRAEVDTTGFVMLVSKGTKLLGVTIVAGRAGELVHEWGLMLENGMPVRNLTTTIHVYPTYSLANVKAAGAMLQEQLLKGSLGRIARGAGQLMLRLMRWRRGF